MTQLIQNTGPSSSLHKFSLYLLSDTESDVAARVLTLTDRSGNVTKSIVVSAAEPDSAKFRAMTRALRLVTLRVPKAHMPYAHVPDYLLAYVTETLECGHQLDFFPTSDPLIARRRNCPECAALSQKKPVQSVTQLREKRVA